MIIIIVITRISMEDILQEYILCKLVFIKYLVFPPVLLSPIIELPFANISCIYRDWSTPNTPYLNKDPAISTL